MSLQNNARLAEVSVPVLCYSSAAPSSNAAGWIKMNNDERLSFIVVSNVPGTTSTTLTIGLQQASDTNGTGVKTLAFTSYDKATNYASTFTGGTNVDRLTNGTAASTFTTDATTGKASLYVLDVQSSDLDVTNNFNCVRLNPATTGAGATLTVIGLARASAYPSTPPQLSVT